MAFPLRNIAQRRMFLLLDLESFALTIVIPKSDPKLIPKALIIDIFGSNILNKVSKNHNNIPVIRAVEMTNVHSAPSNDHKYELHWKSL